MTKVNRLLGFYLLALAILFASVAANLVLTDRLAEQIAGDASDINVSGRQRMLSQRIIYLAHDLATDPQPGTRAALLDTIAEFEAALDMFERSHIALSGRSDLDDGLAGIYFSEADGPSLDARIRRYIALGRAIARDPEDGASLAALKEIEQAGLLADLDAAVTRIEEISVAKVAWLRRAEELSLAFAAVIVLLEVALVFLPGHRIIRASMREIVEKKDQLAAQADALERERARLALALDASEELRREQAEFTYAVSHDLKSPANSLSMLLREIDLSLRERADTETREMLDQSHRTVERMTTLVEDVLAYAWSTDRREDTQRVDLGEVVDETLEALDEDVRAAGARITVDGAGELHGYRRQIGMLVRNLVSNAIKFRHADRAPEIAVTLAPLDGGGIVLEVADNGIGVAAAYHDRIFGMFQRLHRQDEFAGTGLGLCTCLRIAANHDGRIRVASEEDAGATFTVELRPVGAEEPGETAREAA